MTLYHKLKPEPPMKVKEVLLEEVLSLFDVDVHYHHKPVWISTFHLPVQMKRREMMLKSSSLEYLGMYPGTK